MKKNLEKIALSGIRSFSEYCSQFEDIVYLTIGEPDFDTPDVIKNAAITALNNNITHYPPAIGHTSLRKAIASHETKLQPLPVDISNIIITNGATEGITCALWSILDAKDTVIVPTPCFALYFSQIELIGAEVVPLMNATDNFQISPSSFEVASQSNPRAIILTSPNNPTGAVLNHASLSVVYEYAKAHPDFYIILDEVYRTFLYDGEYPSIRDHEDILDQIITVQSFSKSYAMTGWRLGYVVAKPDLIQEMHKLHQNLVTGVSSFIQEAGIAALNFDNQYMADDYRKRRDYVHMRLNAMGLTVDKPSGAFYIFPYIGNFNSSSLEFAKTCLREAKIAVIPGIYFGQEGYVRISYCYSMDSLIKAMDRLERWLTTEL